MKRGASHIEMILSFVIFIAAIGFAIYFFRPTDYSRVIDSSSEYLFREIEANSSSDVLVYSVKINFGVSNEIVALNLSGSGANSKSVVFGPDGNKINSRKQEELVYVSNAGQSIEGKNIKIVLSEDLQDDDVNNADVNESAYNIASSERKKILSEKRIILLMEKYSSDYSGLKKQFNMPNRVNFGFALNFADGTTVSTENSVSEDSNLIVKNKRVEVLRSNGKIEFADLAIKIW